MGKTMRLPRLRTLLSALLVFLLLVLGGGLLALQSDALGQWAGPRLVKLINGQIRGTLTVGKIKGNPFTGYFFADLKLTSPEGKIFQARELELRLSLASLLSLRPSLRLALIQPSLWLRQDPEGRWNLEKLLPPSKEPGGPVWLPISALHLAPFHLQDGEITLEQPGGTQQYRRLNLDLTLTLSQPLTDRQSLEVHKLALKADTPWGPYSLAGALALGQSRVRVDSFLLKSGAHRLLSLAGAAPLTDGQEKLKVTGVLGPIPGEIVARFSPKWPADWGAGGKLELAGSLSRIRVNFQGKVHQAGLALAGRLSRVQGDWHYDLALQVKDLPPKILAVLDPARAQEYEQSTPLNAQLHLKGAGLAWPPKRFAWNLEVKPLAHGRAKLAEGRVRLEGNEERQKLEGLVTGNFGKVSLKAQGSFFKAPHGEITLQVEAFQPGLLAPGVPEGSLFTGKFAGRVSLRDLAQPQRVAVAGDLKVQGRLAGHPLREFRGSFTWEQPRLTLRELRVHLGNLRADLRGSLEGNQVNISHRGQTTPGGSWPVPAALGGFLSWEGRVSGSLAEPAYVLKLSGRQLSWDKVDLKSLSLTANGQGLPPRSGTLDLKAQGVKTPAGNFAQVNFHGQGASAQWQFTLKAAPAAAKKGPRLEMAGTADFSSRPLSLTLARLEVKVPKITVKNQGQVQLRFLPGLELAPATLAVNQGTVAARANLRDGQISALLSVKDLPLGLARVPGLTGKIQARLSLEGQAASPRMESQISLTAGKWQEFSFQSVRANFTYGDSSLALNAGLQESRQGGRLSLTGRLPLEFSLQPFKFALLDKDMDLKLRGEGASLALVTIFTQEVRQAEAPLNLTAEVKGRPAKPQVTGELSWGAGQIVLRQAGATYRLQPGSLRWASDRLTLPQLTLQSQGTATMSAEMAFTGFAPQKVTAKLALNDFQALNKLGSDAYLNGVVNLTGPWSALVVDGSLTIPRANLNPALLKQNGTQLPADYILVGVPGPKARKSEEIPVPDPYRNLKIAVSLEASQNVRVVDKMAKIELALAVQIKKRPGGPLLVGGTVRSLQGNIEVYGKDFVLERGLVTLPGVPDQEPFVQARAAYQMTDASFIVDVSGPVNNPKIDLSSSPPMPPNDLLSYLIFDRPTSTLTKQEYNVTQQAVGVLGGITARKIQEFLGKDFPVLGDVSLKSSQGTIGVTKPLTKGVTLSVERQLNPAQGDNPVQLRLQYRINRHFSLEAEGGQGRSGADALFNYEW